MRRVISFSLVLAFCTATPLLLTSCGQADDFDIDISRKTIVASYDIDLALPAHIDVALPASFVFTSKSLDAAMAPETVQTIDRLKPEYAEALVTDALNFTEVRRRT